MSDLPLEEQREAPEIRTVRIRELVRNPRFQVRRKLEDGIVRRYASAYLNEIPLPPVKVAKVNNAFILVDGWHRVAALERIDVHEVDALVVETTERAALWMAAEANLTHGLPLKAVEIRKAFKAYIRARQHYSGKKTLKSYREIAQELGGLRSYGTIRVWMKKDFPHIFEQMSNEDHPKGKGGLEDIDPGDALVAAAGENLNQFLAAFPGVNDPAVRGRFIHMTEQALQAMKDSDHKPYVEDF